MPSPICNRRGLGFSYPMLATQLTRATALQRFSVASNATLQMSGDFTFAGWIYHDNVVQSGVFSKWNNTAGSREYALYSGLVANKFSWLIRSGATDNQLNSSYTITTGAWDFIVVWADDTGKTINMQVNDGTVDSLGYAGAQVVAASTFYLGCDQTVVNSLSGRMDAWGYWKRVLTAAERTTLYKGSTGMAFKDTTALRVSMTSFWDFDGNGNDSFGTNHGVAENGPTFVAGKR